MGMPSLKYSSTTRGKLSHSLTQDSLFSKAICNTLIMAAAMTNSQQPTPSITFGVEIECLVPWLFDDQEDPHGHVPDLPPAFRMSREEVGSGDPSDAASGLVFQKVQDTINTLGLSSTLVKKAENWSDPLYGYAFWEVEHDASVRSIDNLGYESTYSRESIAHWVPLEIQSPVEVASEGGRGGAKAFEIIRYVIDVLTSKYRIFVNQTCSVHVHVGQAREPLPVNKLQRLGALCFAADPLLFTLHHPLRRVNNYCRPISEYTMVAQNAAIMPRHTETYPSGELVYSTECRDYIGAGLRHGEEPMSWRVLHYGDSTLDAFKRTRRPGHFEPFILGVNWDNRPNIVVERPALSDNDFLYRIVEQRVRSASTATTTAAAATTTHQPARTRTLQRIAIHRLTEDEVRDQRERLFLKTGSQMQRRAPSRGQTPALKAAERIFQAASSCEIEALLSTEDGKRPSINFAAYNCSELETGDEVGTKRTIEFRMGSASLDGVWLSTWARICAGLVRFAIQAPVTRYLDVLTRCDKGTGYDVLDLLDDLGLFVEAEVAERRLAENSKEWDLKFE